MDEEEPESVRQIRALNDTDTQLALLLDITAQALYTLLPADSTGSHSRDGNAETHPPVVADADKMAVDAPDLRLSDEERRRLFGQKAEQWFSTLDTINVNLRRVIRYLRTSRIPPITHLPTDPLAPFRSSSASAAALAASSTEPSSSLGEGNQTDPKDVRASDTDVDRDVATASEEKGDSLLGTGDAALLKALLSAGGGNR